LGLGFSEAQFVAFFFDFKRLSSHTIRRLKALSMNYAAQQFRTVRAWRAALGLLPVPLSESVEDRDRYVLLNGARGSFCLDFVGNVPRKSQRDKAWSCDVGHYVTCVDNSIIVNRWDRQGREETYSQQSVVGQLHEFHRHLQKTSPSRSENIAAHVLRVFRQIRAIVDEENNGSHSLKILLHLLASAAADEYRLERDLEVWGLTPELVEPSRQIAENQWNPLYNDLRGIKRSDDLRPDFQLMLRHSSGVVFQEAHVEAEMSPAYWLPGLERPVFVHSRTAPTGTGIYPTPSILARTLAEEATHEIGEAGANDLVLFDPACGSGELLKECLRLLELKKHAGRLRLIGWDRSQASVDMARFVLAWAKRAWPADQVQIQVTQQDSLHAAWPNNIDILAMNPPFKGWQHMEPQEKEIATRRLGASNKPNLAMVFASLALESLSDEGTLAMITPNSLLEGTSGTSVRAALADMLEPQLIARLGEQTIFARALVDAGIYVGKRRRTQNKETAILWIESKPASFERALCGLRKWRDTEGEPVTDEGFSVYRRQDIGKTSAPWIARQYEAWATHESLKNTKLTVPAKRIFDIKQGVRLGNDVFIVSKEYVQKLPENERRFFRPAVMNLSISDASLNDSYFVFYPYSEGLPDIQSEEDLAQHVPTYFHEFLEPAKLKLSSRKSLAKAKLNWWELLWHRSWQTTRSPKIVSKYFGGQRSFAFDETGDFVAVVGGAWLLEKGAIQLPITNDEIYFAYLAFLSSTTAFDLLKYVSIQVSGGQWDLSNKYVKNLLIPNLAKLEAADLDELIQTGVKIAKGEIENWTHVDKVVSSILTR
jgi:adenine-specific DNA-methyltransferase